MKIPGICGGISLLLVLSASAQETETGKQYAENAFVGNQVINFQSTSVQAPRSWYFKIQHRFGQVGLDSTISQQFLGLDLPSNIRLSLGWSLSDRAYFEIGRSNYQKTVDLEAKYLIIRQTESFRTPVSVAFYFNTAARTERFPNVPSNAYFQDSITPFEYKSTHRFAYNTQLVISSRLTDRFSVQAAPYLIYHNLTTLDRDNYTTGLNMSARFRFGNNSSLLAEYGYAFNNRVSGYHDPLSLGVEFGTAGHVFQVFVTTSTRIAESQIYTSPSADISKGEFIIGFNIQRNFWRKEK